MSAVEGILLVGFVAIGVMDALTVNRLAKALFSLKERVKKLECEINRDD